MLTSTEATDLGSSTNFFFPNQILTPKYGEMRPLKSARFPKNSPAISPFIAVFFRVSSFFFGLFVLMKSRYIRVEGGWECGAKVGVIGR